MNNTRCFCASTQRQHQVLSVSRDVERRHGKARSVDWLCRPTLIHVVSCHARAHTHVHACMLEFTHTYTHTHIHTHTHTAAAHTHKYTCFCESERESARGCDLQHHTGRRVGASYVQRGQQPAVTLGAAACKTAPEILYKFSVSAAGAVFGRMVRGRTACFSESLREKSSRGIAAGLAA